MGGGGGASGSSAPSLEFKKDDVYMLLWNPWLVCSRFQRSSRVSLKRRNIVALILCGCYPPNLWKNLYGRLCRVLFGVICFMALSRRHRKWLINRSTLASAPPSALRPSSSALRPPPFALRPSPSALRPTIIQMCLFYEWSAVLSALSYQISSILVTAILLPH